MLLAYRLYMNTLEGHETLGYFMSRESAEVELKIKSQLHAGYNMDIEEINIQS